MDGGFFEAWTFFEGGGEAETDEGFGSASGEVDFWVVDDATWEGGGVEEALVDAPFEEIEVCEEGVDLAGAFIEGDELAVFEVLTAVSELLEFGEAGEALAGPEVEEDGFAFVEAGPFC